MEKNVTKQEHPRKFGIIFFYIPARVPNGPNTHTVGVSGLWFFSLRHLIQREIET